MCAVFRRQLKSENLKYTPERARILDAAVAYPGPFQADELMARLRRGGGAGAPGGSGTAAVGGTRVSKATVYRTLKLLKDAGILQQILVDAEHAHYVLAFGRGSVGILARTDTHEVRELDLPELDALRDRLCRDRGLKPEGHRFIVYARAEGPGARG